MTLKIVNDWLSSVMIQSVELRGVEVMSDKGLGSWLEVIK